MINVLSDGIQLTEALKSYAKTKLAKLERYNPIKLNCLLKVDNRDNIVELNIDGTFVKIKGDSMYTCIVKAVETACLSLEKNKKAYR